MEQKSLRTCPAEKPKTNVVEIQRYRDEKELSALSKKLLEILFPK